MCELRPSQSSGQFGEDYKRHEAARTQQPLHERISFGGIENEWERGRKTVQTGMEQRPTNGRPGGPHGPAATDLAARLMSGSTCTSRAKPRSAHESGNARTKREEVPRRWSDSLQLRLGGWSDLPQWVERFTPPATPSGQPSATRSASSAPPRNTTGQSTLRCPAQRKLSVQNPRRCRLRSL